MGIPLALAGGWPLAGGGSIFYHGTALEWSVDDFIGGWFGLAGAVIAGDGGRIAGLQRWFWAPVIGRWRGGGMANGRLVGHWPQPRPPLYCGRRQLGRARSLLAPD